jgi:hypothetical protein
MGKPIPLFPKSVRRNLIAYRTITERGPIKDRNELARLRYMQSLKRKDTQ